jgi:hypothetical protein
VTKPAQTAVVAPRSANPWAARSDAPALLYGAGVIAAYLGMTEHACRHLIASKVIPTFKIGSRICARPEKLDAMIEDHEVRAQTAVIEEAAQVVDELDRRRRRACRRA